MYVSRWIKTLTLLKGPDWSFFGIGRPVLSSDNALKTNTEITKSRGSNNNHNNNTEDRGTKEQTIKTCLENTVLTQKTICSGCS